MVVVVVVVVVIMVMVSRLIAISLAFAPRQAERQRQVRLSSNVPPEGSANRSDLHTSVQVPCIGGPLKTTRHVGMIAA